MANSLESAKVRFIEACNTYNDGKHGVWTAHKYLANWEESLSESELIGRLEREAVLMKPVK
jgi:hypothetical protein